MSRSVLAALSISMMLCITCSAELPTDQLPHARTALSSLEYYFTRLRAFSFETDIEYRRDLKFYPKSKELDRGRLEFAWADGKYRIVDRSNPGEYAEALASEMTFDGTKFSRLWFQRGYLAIGTITEDRKIPDDPISSAGNPILQVFEFLSTSLAENRPAIDVIDLLSGAAVRKSYERIASVRVPENSGGDIVVDFRGGPEMDTGSLTSTYRVVFSKEHNFFPISWEQFTEKGDRVHRFTVNEFGDVASSEGTLKYPKVCIREFFGRGDTSAQGVRPIPFQNFSISTKIDRIKNFKLSTEEGEDFSIDPARAMLIDDIDADVLIEVP